MSVGVRLVGTPVWYCLHACAVARGAGAGRRLAPAASAAFSAVNAAPGAGTEAALGSLRCPGSAMYPHESSLSCVVLFCSKSGPCFY